MKNKQVVQPKVFWVCYDGMDKDKSDNKYWVRTTKPSGISGGGNNQDIKVIEYSEYLRLKAEMETKIIEARRTGEGRGRFDP